MIAANLMWTALLARRVARQLGPSEYGSTGTTADLRSRFVRFALGEHGPRRHPAGRLASLRALRARVVVGRRSDRPLLDRLRPRVGTVEDGRWGRRRRRAGRGVPRRERCAPPGGRRVLAHVPAPARARSRRCGSHRRPRSPARPARLRRAVRRRRAGDRGDGSAAGRAARAGGRRGCAARAGSSAVRRRLRSRRRRRRHRCRRRPRPWARCDRSGDRQRSRPARRRGAGRRRASPRTGAGRCLPLRGRPQRDRGRWSPVARRSRWSPWTTVPAASPWRWPLGRRRGRWRSSSCGRCDPAMCRGWSARHGPGRRPTAVERGAASLSRQVAAQRVPSCRRTRGAVLSRILASARSDQDCT